MPHDHPDWPAYAHPEAHRSITTPTHPPYLMHGEVSSTLYQCSVVLKMPPCCSDALRHVLDSFWAVIEWSRTQSTPPLLRTFVDTITPFAELGAPLQAAVHAMRAGICKKLQRGEHRRQCGFDEWILHCFLCYINMPAHC